MNRRQLSFVIILNALISLVIAMAVVWVVEARRPDPEALAAINTPAAAAIDVPMAATLTPIPPAPGGETGAGEQTTEEQPAGSQQATEPAAADAASIGCGRL